MISIKGEDKGMKYINSVARYLYFCDDNKVDWNFIGNAKKIEQFIHYWLNKTTAQAKTLKGYLNAIVFASKFADVHMDICIDKVSSTAFYLKKMLSELTHSREAFLEEQLDDLPEYSEVTKMRDVQNVDRFTEYADIIQEKYAKEANEDVKVALDQKIDWCSEWLASTLCLGSMQRPGRKTFSINLIQFPILASNFGK